MLNRFHCNKGFTLVEMLVSGAIILLSVIAVIAVVRKGREIDINDLHRRMARARINALMESRQYSYTNYNNLTAGTITITTGDTLDDRHDGGTPLRASSMTQGFLVTITNVGNVATGPTTGITVSGKKIRMRIKWREGNYIDSVAYEKLITNMQ